MNSRQFSINVELPKGFHQDFTGGLGLIIDFPVVYPFYYDWFTWELSYFRHQILSLFQFTQESQGISSTQIRQLLVAGRVRQAAYLLGRYVSASGQVVRGAQRGRTIGFPTANLAVAAERLLPANGVYATYIRRPSDNRRLPSVTNVGIRPSFGGEKRTVETYIFDFDEDIYGENLTVELVEYLRPEKKFDGIDELIARIKQDADQAHELLAKEVHDF